MVSFKGEGHRSIKIGSLCIFAALGTKRWWSICLKVNDTMGEVVVKLENRIQHWERVGCDDEGHIYDNDNLTFTGE